MAQSFIEKLQKKWNENRFVCIGLDTDYSKIPQSFKDKNLHSEVPVEAAIYEFNKSIIDSTHDLVCSYKINSAFYEAEAQSWEAMLNTFLYLQRTYPEIPVILDAKRGDVGNTNGGYVTMAFQTLKADAITIHPYLGQEANQPFLDHEGKGIIVLVRTSNPGAGEFQDLAVEGRPLYEIVAENVATKWNKNGNCAVVVGATYPEELKKVREIVGDMPILVPGIGAQGGDLEGVLANGLNKEKNGLIISSSRAIIYAEDPRKACEELDNQINGIIKQ